MNKIYSKFKAHILLLFIRFIGIVSLFSSFKLINVIYGEKLLGSFSTSIVFVQLLSLLVSFGLPIFTVKELSIKELSRRSNEESNVFFSNIFSKIIYNSLLVITTSTILFYALSSTGLFNSISYITFFSIIVCVPITSLINLNAQAIRANGGHVFFQWLNANLLYLFFTAYLLMCYFFEIKDIYLLSGFLFCTLLTFVFSIVFLPMKIRLQKFNNFKDHIKFLKKGFDFFVTQFVTQAFNWVSILFTALFIGGVEAGGLNVINKYLSLTSLLIMVVNMRKGPDYTHSFHQGKIKELNKDISVNTKFMFFLTLPIILILFIFPEFFLNIFSNEYTHLSLVFRIMLVGYLINLYCGSVGMLMQMTNEQKIFRNIMAIALCIHLLLGFVLTKYIGILGLGISLALSLIFWNIFSIRVLKKKYNLISYLTLNGIL